MSIIFEGVDIPTACCFVDGEHSAFAHFEYCKFYNVCKQREAVKTNYKPSDCPVKALEQELVLDQIDEIITDALDKSTDQKESQTLRWVLDKISEVT